MKVNFINLDINNPANNQLKLNQIEDLIHSGNTMNINMINNINFNMMGNNMYQKQNGVRSQSLSFQHLMDLNQSKEILIKI
jgi:hypothetical protein